MKHFFLPILLASSLFAEVNLYPTDEPKISVQNTILTTVNDNTISVIDVMKKLDLVLHQNYPDLADSAPARFQFYSNNWKHVFTEMIDSELILADAEAKEIKLTDGEIREEMERRFGPNVQATLDKIGLSYEDSRNLIRKELIVQRMMWFFVHSKALTSVSPQEIRQAYKQYLREHPAYRQLTYRVFTIRTEGDDAPSQVQEAYNILTAAAPDEALDALKAWEAAHTNSSIQCSAEYCAKDQDLSASHKDALNDLSAGTYSQPVTQMSRAEKRPVHRIFYLVKTDDYPAPAFEDISLQLKNELTNKAVAQEAGSYLQRLRKHYGFDTGRLKESVPDDFQPFQLQ